MNNIERFRTRFNIINECWVWDKPNNDGYGFFRMDGRTYTAHAASWVLFQGEIPYKYTVDHLCRNRSCVNPDHLEPVPHVVNIRRGTGHGSKAHCPRKHEYNEKNTRVYRGMRYCRACDKERKVAQ